MVGMFKPADVLDPVSVTVGLQGETDGPCFRECGRSSYRQGETRGDRQGYDGGLEAGNLADWVIYWQLGWHGSFCCHDYWWRRCKGC